MSDPTREATCPCAGRCHHDTHPCSLGCWSAQKPWRAEDALAALSTTPAPLVRERVIKALDSLDVIDGIVDDTHPEGDGCPLCHELDNLREVLDALRSTP